MKGLSFLGACLISLALATSASAASLVYVSALNGAQESPSVTTTGVGGATITIDDVNLTMRVEADFANLSTGAIAAHIHCCYVPGGPANVDVATTVPTFPGFPTGTSGSYDQTFDLNDIGTYNPTFVTATGGTVDGARTALLAGLASSNAYFNIHSQQYQTGEIRGFLVPCENNHVPEPGLALLALVAVGSLAVRRRA
jgi:hypothetical protein